MLLLNNIAKKGRASRYTTHPRSARLKSPRSLAAYAPTPSLRQCTSDNVLPTLSCTRCTPLLRSQAFRDKFMEIYAAKSNQNLSMTSFITNTLSSSSLSTEIFTLNRIRSLCYSKDDVRNSFRSTPVDSILRPPDESKTSLR